MKQKIFCVIAGQRAGTTAFRSLLASTGRFENFGEIFHTEEVDQRGRYFGFCKKNQILISDIRTSQHVRQQCIDYLDELRELAGQRHILIDIKFNSWNVLSPPWRYQGEEPFLLSFLKNEGTYFALIRRRRVFEQIASEWIARATDQWHNLSLEKLPQPITLNIDRVRRQTRLICQSETFFAGHLKSSNRCLRVDYEDLFESGVLSAAVNDELENLFEEKFTFSSLSAIQKNEGIKSQLIVNYDEAVAAVEQVVARFGRN